MGQGSALERGTNRPNFIQTASFPVEIVISPRIRIAACDNQQLRTVGARLLEVDERLIGQCLAQGCRELVELWVEVDDPAPIVGVIVTDYPLAAPETLDAVDVDLRVGSDQLRLHRSIELDRVERIAPVGFAKNVCAIAPGIDSDR